MRKSKAPPVTGFSRYVITLAIAAVCLLTLVWLQRTLPYLVGPYQLRMVMLSGIAIILAVSLNLVNGFAGQFSLGHAGFYAIGAYCSAYLTRYWGESITGYLTSAMGLSSELAVGVLMLMAIGVGLAAAFAAGIVVGLPSLRLRGDYLAIATLGFGEAIVVIIQNTRAVGAQRGFSGIPAYTEFSWVFAFVVLVILFSRNLAMSAHGRALFAIREDDVAAESAGVDVCRYKVMVFAMSAAWAGVAGALFAHYEGYLAPKAFGFMKSVDIVVMVVLGGGGSVTGAVAAAVVLTALPEMLRGMRLFGVELQEYRMVAYAALLVVLMLTRPQGVLGRSELSFVDIFRRLRSRIAHSRPKQERAQ